MWFVAQGCFKGILGCSRSTHFKSNLSTQSSHGLLFQFPSSLVDATPKEYTYTSSFFCWFKSQCFKSEPHFFTFFPIECRSWLRSSCVSWSTHGLSQFVADCHRSMWWLIPSTIDIPVTIPITSFDEIPYKLYTNSHDKLSSRQTQ